MIQIDSNIFYEVWTFIWDNEKVRTVLVCAVFVLVLLLTGKKDPKEKK